MNEIRKTTQFKKDFKRIKHDDKEEHVVELTRLGTHSELYGKGKKR